MRELHFKDYFWNGELTSTGGYDCIIQHLNDGKRTCKEIEDFMKARASIEEKYAKELLGLSKKVCGHNEMNTLKRSLDMFKLQTEHVSLSHLQLAQTMRDEAKKLEDFRERQKETRKKVEQQMDALHKQRATQFKKTMETKKTYEQKCRDKEEAEQNMNRNASTSNVKQQEKLLTKTQQAKQNAEEADRLYMHNVSVLGKTREDWQKEHIKACEVFEKQEVERINTLRNMVWTHLNQLSQQCVTSDELHEEVRKSLEQCDIQEDIEHFVNLRRTGDKPPAPVLYENFYSGQRVPAGPPSSRTAPPITRRGPLPNPDNTEGDVIYSTVDPGYSALQY
ncbi:proline-serine-threonine phosphatase-interacting protein 2 [Oncorhynchus tshawytscha]|uniref:proline-serine-threonine phosphatase-interacting protein 2 n=1 Tax=Oncorhynchus tshawytscha TaxID=74940 RepID=UPI000D0A09BA|nr:proline-serine-threonine phosphatase-interacting protein 2 [Oncorhynchus tshawytscha]XP_024286553.1 proline-serine-threonine phosphatase-interacting protein 2 [Oncorhynchus tshawytscha]XP_029502894.1 proline-serine-threonine phosphatase-interacting protein 2-like isoform X1 [Oncorhynchus nerka]